MSNAWEVTEDDVNTVLKAHGLIVKAEYLSELHDNIDVDAVEDAVLQYNKMDDQISSAIDEIENQLIEMKVISCKKFLPTV